MRKVDNKGFSLVELLIAVCILAIIVVPILNSFLSSYRVNARSKQTMRATTLAQNEMEIFEKEHLDALSDPAKFAYDPTANPHGYQITEGSDGVYNFVKKGVINDDTGREMFDVYITLDPKRASSGERYATENSISLLTMNTVSAVDSGTYVQSIYIPGKPADEDTSAYQEFFNAKLPTSIWTTIDPFKENIKRVITVDITQYEDSGKTFTRAKVTYEYSLTNPQVMPVDDMVKTPVKQMIYDNTQNLDDAGNPIELKSVYLFYTPRYNTNTIAGVVDEIIIHNDLGLPIDIYVIRQNIKDDAGTAVVDTPMNYKPFIKIFDKVNAEGKTGGKYHTNVNINKSQALGLGDQVTLEFTDTGSMSGTLNNTQRNDIITKTGLKELGTSEVKDRIYEMSVEVYSAGANKSTATPLATLTGTKLE